VARTALDWTSSDWPCEADLERAVGYVAAVRGTGSPVARVRAAARDRAGLRSLLTLAAGLPVVEADFSASPSGQELRSWFRPDRRVPVDRVPVALLRLPATPAEYLRGRPRQALRTNVTRAAQAGLTAEVMTDGPELRGCVAAVAALRGQEPDRVLRAEGHPGVRQLFVVVRDRAGDPVALSESVVDGRWAGLGALVIALGHPDNQVMRYLLHVETVKALMAEGVQALTVGGSMLLTSTGTRYFQRRTGYQPVWLRPLPPGRAPRRSVADAGAAPAAAAAGRSTAAAPRPRSGTDQELSTAR